MSTVRVEPMFRQHPPAGYPRDEDFLRRASGRPAALQL